MPGSDQRTTPAPLPNNWFYALVAIGVILNATGLFPPILEPDGALYANIAKEMAQSGDFVNLYAVGSDWLDKPHFPFWVTALSFQIFGITTFGYKFPALLFFFASVVYTYQFTRLMYPKLVAQVATLVLLTAFHGVLSNFDVRAEPYLMGLIIGAVYHFWLVYDVTPASRNAAPPLEGRGGVHPAGGFHPSPFFKGWCGIPRGRGGRPLPGGEIIHLILGSLLTGCALMTKGVFVLVPIGAGLVVHWLLTGQWRELLKPRWYVAVAVSFLFTLPEIYCLYQQFDLHPEKVVFGGTNVSGVRFFFWDSQFGRFFNTGPIKGAGDKFFFVHTLLWAFLPWSLPLYVGVGKMLVDLIKRRGDYPEYVSLGSGLATFALFSLSGFQLPHYMNIVFPFFAILTARYVVSLTTPALQRWFTGQSIIAALIWVLAVGLVLLVRPNQADAALVSLTVIQVAVVMIFRNRAIMLSLMGRMVGTMLVLASTLNLFIYPTLMQYEAGMTAARYMNKQPSSAQRQTLLFMPGTGVGGGSFWTYQFYASGPSRYVRSDSALRVGVQRGPQRVFATAESVDTLAAHGFGVRRLAMFPYYHVSQLSYAFLNRDSRVSTLSPYVLVEVNE